MECKCGERCEAIIGAMLQQIMRGCDAETKSLMETLADILDTYNHPDGFRKRATEKLIEKLKDDKPSDIPEFDGLMSAIGKIVDLQNKAKGGKTND